MNIEELAGFSAPLDERNLLLIKLLNYYHHHFDNLENLKSMEIMKEVFH